MNKNYKQLEKFVAYCNSNPELKFWQALVNWSGYNLSAVYNNKKNTKYEDVFYWGDKK